MSGSADTREAWEARLGGGTYQRPRGRAPHDSFGEPQVWDTYHGRWASFLEQQRHRQRLEGEPDHSEKEESDEEEEESEEEVSDESQDEEQQRVHARTTGKTDGKGGGKDGKGRTLSCGICGETLDGEHTGIHCKNAHHMCTDCSANFVSTTLEEGINAIPPKCPFCAVDVNLPSFERQLTTEQHGTYMSYMVMGQLPEGETMVQCPLGSCQYFEIRKLGEGGSNGEQMNFFFCQHPDCRKVSCFLCKKECVLCDSDDDDDDIDPQQLAMMKHFACAEREHEFGELRKAFEKAIEASTQFSCPGCGLTGMKDGECTHMTCIGCRTTWCYVCGLDTASDECSKANDPDRSPEYAHNVNWHTRLGRCPMYLSEINQVDDTYPEDDDGALHTLHRQRALRLLRCACALSVLIIPHRSSPS